MQNKNINLILEGLQNSRSGAGVSKCIKGLSDKDIKGILSNIVGEDRSKSLDLTDPKFSGMLVDIVSAEDFGNFKSYEVEIKSSKNKPWNREWTKYLNNIDGQKYNNGYMLTGYVSNSDIKKDTDRIKQSLNKSNQKDIDNYKKLVGKKIGIYDYDKDDDFVITKFSGKDTFTLKYGDGDIKDVDRAYLLKNTDIEEYID